MLPPLPKEVLDAIAEFLQSESLSQLCRRLRKVLGSHRYVKINRGAEQFVARMKILLRNLRALHFVRSVKASGVEALAALKEAPLLHTLSKKKSLPCLSWRA